MEGRKRMRAPSPIPAACYFLLFPILSPTLIPALLRMGPLRSPPLFQVWVPSGPGVGPPCDHVAPSHGPLRAWACESWDGRPGAIQ